MKLLPYPHYKGTGVEWLGEVPEHWTMPPLYMRYQVDLGKMLNEATISGDQLVPYFRNVDVQWDRINMADLPEMDIGQWELARYTVKRGDILVCEGGEVGRAAIVGDNAEGLGYQKALHRLRPLAISDAPRFMFYSLYGAAHQGVFIAGGNPNTIPHLTGEKLRAYRFPAPPKPEQRAIADFLDRQTEKIDTLVAKKRTLIERLKEKRTALISRTVTRGLPPDAAPAAGLDPHPKLKPSGIDWPDHIPKHWEILRLRNIVVGGVTNGLFKTQEAFGEGTRLINVYDAYRSDFIVNEQSLERVATTAAELSTYRVQNGDVFFVRSSLKLEGVGRAVCCLTPTEELVFECHLVRARPDLRKINPRFLIFYLNSPLVIHSLIAAANTTTMTTISQSRMLDLPVLLPPGSEQKAIAAYLEIEMAKLDTLVETVQTAVERLQEYRTALIIAAVTGKIDVRGIGDSLRPSTAKTESATMDA